MLVDVSDNAMGAVLQQHVDGIWQPLSFFSQKQSSTHRRYNTYDRELLPAYSGIKRFRHTIEGQHFVLYTDHKLLVSAFQQKPERASPRQYRHLDFIGQFSTDIRHIAGENNVVVDTLSSIVSLQSLTPPITHRELAEEQQRDRELESLLQSSTSLQLARIHFPEENADVYCVSQRSRIRPYVPKL